MLLSSKQITTLIHEPEHIIDMFGLTYISDQDLKIQRKKQGKRFSYLLNEQPLTEKESLERIKSLVIPPAWQNVRIAWPPNGHLQVTGRDAKNRKQYRYHPVWNKIRNQTKFYKMTAFAQKLPEIRKQVDRDLSQKKFTKEKVLALVLRLMEETHIRIGNSYYAKKNKTYGLSTLRTRHVHTDKNRLKFEFTGKKGVRHSITLRNKKLIRLVNRCEEIPGWDLFQYYDDEGGKHGIDSTMVNEYIQQISGELFTAKDFRTWSASKIFFATVSEQDIPETQKEKSKRILEAYDITANALGNTRNVCRKYYVHPEIVRRYEENTIQPYFEMASNPKNDKENFSAYEYALLELIKNFNLEQLSKLPKQ